MRSGSASRLLTTEEVSDFLQVPKQTLYRWRHYNIGPPAVRVGRHLRYDWADLMKWLADRHPEEV